MERRARKRRGSRNRRRSKRKRRFRKRKRQGRVSWISKRKLQQ